MINLIHSLLIGVCSITKLIDKNGVNKKREDENKRWSELSPDERYEESCKKYIKNLSR